MNEPCATIRTELLPIFPSIDANNLNIHPPYIMETFILSAKVSKSLIAYLVKLEEVEKWTFNNTPKNKEEKILLGELEEQIVPLLRKLATMPGWESNDELFDHINWILARLPVIQCIYAVKFIDQSTEYLDKVFTSQSENAMLLMDRLCAIYRAVKLTRIFSYSVLDKIINILRDSNHGRWKAI